MAATTQSEVVPSDRDEIPASSTEETNIDSPPAPRNCEISIDKFPDFHHRNSIEEGSAGSLMPLPEIQHPEAELPPLPNGGEESKTIGILDGYIPDSEDVSERSLATDGAKHECKQVHYGESSNVSLVKDSLDQLGVSNDAVPGNSSTRQETSLRAGLNAKEDKKVPDPLAVEIKSGTEPSMVTGVPKAILNSTLRAEPKMIMRATIKPSSKTSPSGINSTLSSHVSLNEGGTSQTDLSNTTDTQPTEFLQEVDAVTIPNHSNCLSPKHDNIGSNILNAVADPTSNAIESRSDISYVETAQAARLSPREQNRGFSPSLLSSSSRVRSEEGGSSQTKHARPLRGPSEFQSKDIMMVELKAMKIVGPAVYVFLCYALHLIKSNATFLVSTSIYYNSMTCTASYLHPVTDVPSVTKHSPSTGNCPKAYEIGGGFKRLKV